MPKTLDLANRRVRWKLLSLLSLTVLACLSVGGALALAIASPRDHALAQIHDLQQQIRQQHGQMGVMRADAQRSLDALAVKVGQLQAQSLRLNVLGERLVQVGKLDGSEFNFDEPPPVGGVEDSSGTGYALPPALETGIDRLTGQLIASRHSFRRYRACCWTRASSRI